MIVTLTGAYKNVGDHLIGDAARKLLKEFVDEDIVNIDRKAISKESYNILNQARAVFLCGGPVYQKDVYPNVFRLDLSSINSKVIPFGVGYKEKLKKKSFTFSPSSLEFLKNIHSKIKYSSARDIKTVEALNENGIENVIMTGCPAWYDLELIDKDIEKLNKIESIAISVSAKVDFKFLHFLKFIADKFKGSKKVLALHHGLFVSFKPRELRLTLYNYIAAAFGKMLGFEIVDLKADLPKMKKLYREVDLHIGHRVHAHLFRLSQRKPSILISEDQRGVSQTMTLGMQPILTTDPNYLKLVEEEIKDVLNGASHNQNAIMIMREKFKVMKKFMQENIS